MQPVPDIDTIVFDLFNTLLHFDYSLLPEIEFEGRRFRTTGVEVHRRLQSDHSVDVEFALFFREFERARQDVNEMRKAEQREFSSLVRFQILQERLGLVGERLAQTMVDCHMREMLRTVHLPPEKLAVLEQLKGFRRVLASNFDHAPTAREALRKCGLQDYFEHIVISDEVGWRKPSPSFFQALRERCIIVPERSVFVGDDPYADVEGAAKAGFQVAWLAEREPLPAVTEQPRWLLRNLSELLQVVCGQSLTHQVSEESKDANGQTSIFADRDGGQPGRDRPGFSPGDEPPER